MKFSLRAMLGGLALSLSSLASANTPPPETNQAPVSGPTSPATPPGGNTQAQSAQEAENKIVCKKLPPPTGSRIGPRKICKTVADWRRQAQNADDVTTEIQRRKGYDGL
jgi:hypothetical protein